MIIIIIKNRKQEPTTRNNAAIIEIFKSNFTGCQFDVFSIFSVYGQRQIKTISMMLVALVWHYTPVQAQTLYWYVPRFPSFSCAVFPFLQKCSFFCAILQSCFFSIHSLYFHSSPTFILFCCSILTRSGAPDISEPHCSVRCNAYPHTILLRILLAATRNCIRLVWFVWLMKHAGPIDRWIPSFKCSGPDHVHNLLYVYTCEPDTSIGNFQLLLTFDIQTRRDSNRRTV